jgi:hypothetical protein
MEYATDKSSHRAETLITQRKICTTDTSEVFLKWKIILYNCTTENSILTQQKNCTYTSENFINRGLCVGQFASLFHGDDIPTYGYILQYLFYLAKYAHTSA